MNTSKFLFTPLTALGLIMIILVFSVVRADDAGAYFKGGDNCQQENDPFDYITLPADTVIVGTVCEANDVSIHQGNVFTNDPKFCEKGGYGIALAASYGGSERGWQCGCSPNSDRRISSNKLICRYQFKSTF